MAIANLCITAELGAVENRASSRACALGSKDLRTLEPKGLDVVIEGLLANPLVAHRFAPRSADALSFSYDINYFIEKFGLRWPDVRFLLQRWGHGVVLEAMRQMASTGAVPRRRGAYLAGICRRLGTEQLSQTPELHTRDNTNSCGLSTSVLDEMEEKP